MQINFEIGNISVRSLVKKHNNRLKKLNKLTSESEKQQLSNTSIIEMKNNTKFPFLDEAYLTQGVLKEIKEFKLTNGTFYAIYLAREKFNVTWDTLCQFMMKKLNCSGVLPHSLSPTFINLKKKKKKCAKTFQSMKTCRKRKFFIRAIPSITAKYWF